MGEIAALATSLFWSLTSVQFALAGRRVGSQVVNRVRLVLAVLNLSLLHFLLYGELWPQHVEAYRWGWLGLSGVVGLVVGDAMLFQAFVMIGPRRAMLLMTLAPVFSGLIAWVWLGEILVPAEWLGILITVGSLAWVVGEPRDKNSNQQKAPADDGRSYRRGISLALGGAIGQALGLVLAKQGLVGEFAALSATLIRMLVAAAVLWMITLARKQARGTWRALADRRAVMLMLGGALTGPTAGVWLSMVAVQNAHVGIASTLMALPPVLLIPLERWLFGARITPRAVLGTAGALIGTAVLFLV